MTIRILLAAIFVGLLACGKAEEHPEKPTLQLDRDSLGFGQEFGSGVYIGTSKQESLLVQNKGLETLVISSVALTGDSAFTMELPESMEVQPLDHTFIRFFFAPLEEKQYTASVTITSNSAVDPQKTLQITGRGVPFGSDGGM